MVPAPRSLRRWMRKPTLQPVATAGPLLCHTPHRYHRPYTLQQDHPLLSLCKFCGHKSTVCCMLSWRHRQEGDLGPVMSAHPLLCNSYAWWMPKSCSGPF